MNEYEALLRLQSIDIELMRYSRQLKAMPQQKRLAALDAAKKKLAVQLTKIVGQRKDCEIDVSDSEAAYQHLVDVRDEVKSKLNAGETGYREIGSIEQQLTSLAKKMEKLEFTHGQKMEALEKASKAEKNARDLDARLDAERKSLEESFKRDSANIMAEVRKLATERKQVLADIQPETLATYERLGKRFDGLCVEQLHGNVPSVCRVKLQPSLYNDIKKGTSIAECPYRHRMLVTEEVAQ